MLKRNLLANYLGQAWAAAIGIVFVPIYIRFLGIESYGLIGLFAVLQAWLVLLDMGLSPTLSREMARFVGGDHSAASIRDLLRSVEIIAIAVAGVIAVLIWLSSPWLATHWLRAEKLPAATVAGAFQVMGLVTALRFIENVYRSALSGLQRQVSLNVANALVATIRSAGAVAVLAWFSNTISAFFIWQAAISVLSIAVLVLLSYRTLPPGERRARFSGAALRQVSRYAGGLLGITLLSLLLTQVDKVLLSRLLPLSQFGYYTLANVLASALFMLIYPIRSAWQPRMVELISRRDETELATVYHLGCQLVSIGAGSVALLMVVFARQILLAWTGDPAMAATTAPLLIALALGNLLNGIVFMPYQLQLAYGWTSLAIRSNVVALCAILPAILLVAPRYGAVGAAWTWVALNAGYFVVTVQLQHRRILPRERGRWYWNDTLLPLAGALGGIAAVRLIAPATDNRVALFAILIAAGSAGVVGASLLAGAVRTRLLGTIPALARRFPELGRRA